MYLPGRHESVDPDGYRYGFNGMELDDEIKRKGNSYDFGARMYDSRIGRWFAIDKYQVYYPNQSPYSFALNDPINIKDADGNIAVDSNGNPIYTSDGYAWQETTLADGSKIYHLVENRTYFSNKGEKISAVYVVANWDASRGEDPSKYTSEDIKNVDERFKSFCYNDALYMTQIKNGGDPDDPIPDNFKLQIPGGDNAAVLQSILEDEYAFRTNDVKNAKPGDVAVFKAATSFTQTTGKYYFEMNGITHFSTYKGNEKFRSKNDVNPMNLDLSWEKERMENVSFADVIRQLKEINQSEVNIGNINSFTEFHYFLGYKTELTGVTDEKGQVNIEVELKEDQELSDIISEKIKSQYDKGAKKREKTQAEAKKKNG